MYLIYDTETTGLPKSYTAPPTDTDNWPRMVQIAWQLHDKTGKLIENECYIVRPDGFDIPFNSVQIHGITTEKALEEGLPLTEVLERFRSVLKQTEVLGGHNLSFDQGIVGAEFVRNGIDPQEIELKIADTMKSATDFCQLPGGRGGGFKPPTLNELHKVLFGNKFEEAHNAAADVNATARCFMEMIRRDIFNKEDVNLNDSELLTFKEINTDQFQPFAIKIESQVEDYKKSTSDKKKKLTEGKKATTDAPYFHFHNHTSFSILTATTSIDALVAKAIEEKMPAVGITDTGNMMGAFKFVNAVQNANNAKIAEINELREKNPDAVIEDFKPIIPIIGTEVYIAENYLQKKFTKDAPDRKYTQILLAKDKAAYLNLSMISSISYIDGLYAGTPRVGKEIIEQYSKGLIATTGTTDSEIPYLILNVGEKEAEKAFEWYHSIFKDDFYAELIRHGLPEEEHVNQTLLKFAKKYNVKVIAQNNTFYINQEDAEAQDILLCVKEGEKKATPIGKGRDGRFGFPNDEFYFKTQDQMRSLFYDIPEAIENLSDLLEKITPFGLASDVLLPKFDIPDEFKVAEDEMDGGVRGEMAYLRHLTYEGAVKRYNEITEEIKERLDFELDTIEKTGYPGYFLIVQDFTSQARKMGVSVGPGRGSAAGSAVAYCIGITNVDPIKYNLLFERFLNPDRVSMPDIDIDFDDRGREKVIQWVVNKYGKNQVAQIITYGTMAGKSAVRDTGRVLDLPLSETDRIAKKMHIKLADLFQMNESQLKSKLSGDELSDTLELKEISQKHTLEGETLQQAKVIEGSLRNTGVHACGVIITPKDIREMVPVATAKDSEQLITQFDNSVVENAGLLKMDFLGLRTLTIINDAIELIEKNYGRKIDIDTIPLDDPVTYELFQRAETVGIFQYESPGMQKHLRDLKPDKFDDLIAMNALYRPGPLQYIPNFIARKQGREPIVYDLPDMEEFLSETYGITVYQEQVMLLSQKLAGFTKGEADMLRKAMGKKQEKVLAKMKPNFLEGGAKNNHPEKVLEKIWHDWEAFASYAFNKSHSTCYALVAYQTAYLKSHYPAEFMASVLSNNMNNIKDVSFNMEECRSIGVPVLGPDVNESSYYFSVNKEGAIRFGMGAVKGVGSNAVESIIAERNENGRYKDIFDFVQRVELHQVNKKTMENLILAGSFDELEPNRAQFFYEEGGTTNLEKLIKFGAAYQDSKNSSQTSLFGDAPGEIAIMRPNLPACPPWGTIQRLNREKEVVGIYISNHPLNDYKTEIDFFTNISIKNLKENEDKLINRECKIAGIVTSAQIRISAKDEEYGTLIIEDFSDQYEIRLFKEDLLKFKHFLQVNMLLAVRLRVTEKVFKDREGNRTGSRIYVNVANMALLSEILEKEAESINLYIDLKTLNTEMGHAIQTIAKKHRGNKKMNLTIIDTVNKQELEMSSPGLNVEISRELVKDLSRIPGMIIKPK